MEIKRPTNVKYQTPNDYRRVATEDAFIADSNWIRWRAYMARYQGLPPRLAQELALDQWRRQPPHTDNLEKLRLHNPLR